MIHRRKGRKLKRTASHRRALLSNLSVSLIQNKKIRTTVAKAKELRRYIENLITKSKRALQEKEAAPERVVHMRRVVNRFLKDKGAVKTLFDEIAPKAMERPGGYTRVLKLGRRYGDAAELAVIELVDYNIEKTEQKITEKPATASKGKLLKSIRKKRTKKSRETETKETSEKASKS
jgi:large subunit ribosomal protein L17